MKGYIPDGLYRQLHQAAMPSAGGKASWRNPEISIFEKMSLTDMMPYSLAKLDDEELIAAWIMLNRWYLAAKKRKQAIENYVNAAVYMISEMKKRKIEYDDESEIAQEASNLSTISKKLHEIPTEKMLVQNFVCMVGSAAKGNNNPKDLDILIRAKQDSEGNYLIQSDGIHLPIRNVFKEVGLTDNFDLHYIDNPQGPHDDHVPIYDLILRRTDMLQKNELTKQNNDDETSGEMAEKNWNENWQNMFPKSGNGKFVYQHHWRGLDEQETELSDQQLLNTDHSLHSDLRFTGANDSLFGFSIFLGKTSENKPDDKIINIIDDDKLRCSVKSEQPEEWLYIGVDKPFVAKPGDPGATFDTFAKIFALDSGEYDLGVMHEHFVELFLKGKLLKGRYLFASVPTTDNERAWMISKPKEQTPLAQTKKMEDVITELKAKGHKLLAWCEPGSKPKLIDIRSGKIAKNIFSPILCSDEEKQILYCVVAEPDSYDTYGHKLSRDEIEKACHDFIEKLKVGIEHVKSAENKVKIVENILIPDDVKTFYNKPVTAGSWITGMKINDSKIWEDCKNGTYTGVSYGGFARINTHD